jgi:hypothetical protein
MNLDWNELMDIQFRPHFQNRLHDAIGVIFAGEKPDGSSAWKAKVGDG